MSAVKVWCSVVTALLFLAASASAGTSLIAWGANESVSTNIPTGMTNIVGVSGGGMFAAALLSDGTVRPWGLNHWGQTNVPPYVTNVVSIASGYGHMLALQADGTIRGWGYAQFGQTNPPPGLSNVVAVGAATSESFALHSSGTVRKWGAQSPAVPSDLIDVAAISVRSGHAIAVKRDGTIMMWASINLYGETNAPPNLTNVASVAVGAHHSLALKRDGTVIAWGRNHVGQTNTPADLTDIISIAAGAHHSMALRRDGTVVVWGDNSTGQTNVPAGLSNVVAITSSDNVCIAVVNDGAPFIHTDLTSTTVYSGSHVKLTAGASGKLPLHYQWERNGTDLPHEIDATLSFFNVQVGDAGEYRVRITNSVGSITSRTVKLDVIDGPPIVVAHPSGSAAWPGRTVTLRVLADGSGPLSYQWQKDGADLVGSTSSSLTLHSLRLKDQGSYSALVSNVFGSTASGAALVTVSPITVWGERSGPPFALSNVIGVAARQHFLALRSDKTVAAWGYNYNGQANVPSGLSNVIEVAAGPEASMALREDGSLAVWGNLSTNLIPAAATNLASLAMGGFHQAVLKADGTVVAWGANDYGQSSVPAGLRNVVALAAGNRHTIALQEDGRVVAWGMNSYGQASVPGNLSNVVAIAATFMSTLALKSDGSLVAWGDNSRGELNIPANLTNVIAIAGGYFHYTALRADGTVVCWGWNNYGQTNVPAELRYIGSVAGGGYSTVAVATDDVPLIVARPLSRTVTPGSTVTLRVAAVGDGPFSYQWRIDGSDIPGATDSFLTLSDLPAGFSGRYTVVVQNQFGSVTSAPAIVASVDMPPSIMRHPSSRTAWPGRTVQLDVVASGTSPQYQWRLNGIEIASATNSVFLLPSVEFHHAGNYSVLVSNHLGTVISSNAFLKVSPVNMWGVTKDNWGAWVVDEGEVPPNLTNAIAIASGDYHALAIRSNGTVVAWGNNYSGQTNVPGGLNNVVAISAGEEFCLALRQDGTVRAWGSASTIGETAIPSGLSNVVAIASGAEHSVALRADGTVVGWGAYTNVPPGLTNVIQVAAGGHHSLALKQDGTVALLTGSSVHIPPPSVTNIIAVSAGGKHSLALKADGTVVAWGSNVSGETNVPPGLSNIVAVAAGGSRWEVYSGHSLALKKDGTVVRWGGGNYVDPPPDLCNVIALESGRSQGVALVGQPVPVLIQQPRSSTVYKGTSAYVCGRATGLPPFNYQWRLNGTNIIGATNFFLWIPEVREHTAGEYSVEVGNAFGTATSTNALVSYRVQAPTNVTPLTNQIAWPGKTITFHATGSGSVPITYQWQFNGVDIEGATSSSYTITNASFGSGGTYTVVMNNDGGTSANSAQLVINRIIAWGLNSSGQCNVPPGLTNVVALAGGGSFSLALTDDGRVHAWGTTATNVPASLSNVIAIAAGSSHAAALRSDGTVACWGSSIWGQTSIPQGLTNVISISSRGDHTLALRADRTVVAWGRNNYGQCNVPSSASNVISIAAGGFFSLAITRDGNLIGWGDNRYGQTNAVNTSNFVAIAGAELHRLGLRSNDVTYAAGYNWDGQTWISGVTNVVRIAAGNQHSLALKADGIPIASGKNDYGQRDVPLGLFNVIDIAGGRSHSLALVGDGLPNRYTTSDVVHYNSNKVTLGFTSKSGRLYSLQHTDSIYNPTWSSTLLLPGTGSNLHLDDPTPPPNHRFYRVRQW